MAENMETMTHPDEGTLQAHLDGETPGADAERIREHLAGCAACAARLGELEADRVAVAGAVSLLDVSPSVDAARMELRDRLAARSGPAERRRTEAGGRAGSFSRRALARAAILLLLVAGVAADRLPGSPFQGWLGELAGQVRSALAGGADDAPGTTTDAAAGAAESGVRVSPAGGRVRVVLTGLPPGSRIDVRLVDGAEAGVRGMGGGRYRTAPGLIEVVEPGAGVRVEIPRAVPSATVEVDGRVYLRKEGGRLEVAGPATDSTEAELRFRTPGGDDGAALD